MRAAGISELKKELQLLSPLKLAELCTAMAKYKKENKEYLSYLLFESHDKQAFVAEIKTEINDQFSDLRTGQNLYYIKKSLRKILRTINRYNKYMVDKALAAELLIYFLQKLKSSGIPYHKSQLIINMYDQQVKKINGLVNALHEDLQGDFKNEMEELASGP